MFFQSIRVGRLERQSVRQIRSRTIEFAELLFEWICAVSSTHRYDRVSNFLSGRQTTHAAQRTAKSTLTYEPGTGESFPPLLPLFAPLRRHRDGGRVNGPRTASARARGFPRPFPRLLIPDHVSSDHFSIELLTLDLLQTPLVTTLHRHARLA